MKKLFSLLAIAGMLVFGGANVYAQDETTPAAEQVSQADDNSVTATQASADEPEDVPIHKAIKTKFIEGGAGFMACVLIALILGLAVCIERIIYLGLSYTNKDKLLFDLKEELSNGKGIEDAKVYLENKRGPLASIFYQGLLRYTDGSKENIAEVENAIVSYGAVEMGKLEKGVTWINLFISLSPMLGFMGTVIGMIGAFDAIEQAGDISTSVVAGGIKVALITTVAGLIAAMILQVFCNLILSMIESLTNDMEDASISFVDLLIKK